MVKTWEGIMTRIPLSSTSYSMPNFILSCITFTQDLYKTCVATKLKSDQQTWASGSSLHSWHGLEVGEMRRLHTQSALFHHLRKGEFHLFILAGLCPTALIWFSDMSPVFFPELSLRSVSVHSFEISVISEYHNELFLWIYGWVLMWNILPECKVQKSSLLYKACITAQGCCIKLVVWDVLTGYTCLSYFLPRDNG